LSPQKRNNKSKSNAGPDSEGGDYVRVRLPNKKKGEIFGIADQLLGASHIKVMCADGKSRMARIPGKMKKRMWIREGDLIILQPWSFQDEKADVIWRYTKTQASYLSRKKMIPDIINIF
jgi:translation initiation factor 1A